MYLFVKPFLQLHLNINAFSEGGEGGGGLTVIIISLRVDEDGSGSEGLVKWMRARLMEWTSLGLEFKIRLNTSLYFVVVLLLWSALRLGNIYIPVLFFYLFLWCS